MPTYFCETDDVRAALQESQQSFDTEPLGTAFVEQAIAGASAWFRNATDAYFYDSDADPSDLVDSSPATVTDIELSVPSSPHQQSGQLFASGKGGRAVPTTPKYPNANAGPYVKMQLPLLYAESVDTMRVRDVGGEYEDWVAASDKDEGRGEDYYVTTDGTTAYGRSYLFIRASSIGTRKNYDHLIQADITHGKDEQDESWQDVRRGIAALAAADLVTDSDLQTLIPDNGNLLGVDTKADRLLDMALGDRGALSPYL